MATRTVTVLFYNNTSVGLTLQSSSTQGSWVTAPPATIPPNLSNQVAPHHWETESPSGGGNASGTATYQLDGASQLLTLTWNSNDGKSNSYTDSAPSGYSVGIQPSGDVTATVTYTFTTSI